MDHRGVPPARVRGNNWRDLAVALADDFEPQLPVSVVVAYYEAPEALDLTLAALEGQTYPRELFEVVVVDDGSRTSLAPPCDSPLNVRVLHQEDRGFGLARARNTGARAAAHEILVFLDCDMMPEAGWLAEHARWHHAANDALTLGFRAHVEVDGIDADAVRTRPGALSELFADRPADRPAWIEFHMTRTRELTSDDDDLFRTVTGGNLGISRALFEAVGGYDETFTQWGAEDTEFGYRAYTLGALLVPAREALCWHQGAGAAPDQAESDSLELQQAKLSQLIAHYGFRRAGAGRSFTVPQYVVTVQEGDPEAQIETAEQVLACSVHDLVVWVDEPQDPAARDDPARERIRRLLSGDPRVRFGRPGAAAESIPAAAFHISVPAGATVKPDAVRRLRRELGAAARSSIKLGGGQTAEMVRARALNRAARSEIRLDAHGDGGSRQQDKRRSILRKRLNRPARRQTRLDDDSDSHGLRRGSFPRLRKLAQVASHLKGEAVRVRSLSEAMNLVKWFLSLLWRAVSWRVRRTGRRLPWKTRRLLHAAKRLLRRLPWKTRRLLHAAKRLLRRLPWKTRRLLHAAKRLLRRLRWMTKRLLHQDTKPERPVKPPSWRSSGDGEVLPADYRLGPEMAALGSRAESVLAASVRIGTTIGALTETIIVDTPEQTGRIDAESKATVVVLSESDPRASVPAFDAEQLTPMRWSIEHTGRSVALGPPEHLPRPIRARGIVSASSRAACRRAHHVVDTAAYHEDALTRAGTLAALAATGAVVYLADHSADLYHRLGSNLYSLMCDEGVVSADQHEREAFSVAMRRNALRDHSLRARVRQLLGPTGLRGPPLPEVSILLATRRPDRVAAAIDSVACQKYPRVELVLALHGDGFDRTEVARLLEGLGCPARVVEVAGHLPLGAVLNAAAAESSGTLLTKFDDDDIYGPEHLWDLVLAHEYSRAPLVGKGAEFVYLAGSDVTLHRFRGGGERYITTQSIAGGALMVTRGCFDAVLGWRPIPRSVDQALIEDVVSGGHRAYRTHGMGYVLVRHGEGHTWRADDDYFLAQAHETRAGCDLDFAGIALPGSHGR